MAFWRHWPIFFFVEANVFVRNASENKKHIFRLSYTFFQCFSSVTGEQKDRRLRLKRFVTDVLVKRLT